MRRYLQQGRRELVVGWLLAVVASTVYLLTLEPTASFWDCGEFIAVSYLLQVGHPPGAPFYQLLAHAFSWFAGGDVHAVARCCNALSAVAGGFTVMFLYWSILLLGGRVGESSRSLRMGALVGSLCYLFCDTAWFSAVESEVYSLAMLIASVELWAMLRWYRSPDPLQSQRWLLMIALLMGLGICTHLLTFLVTPVLLLTWIFRRFCRSDRSYRSDRNYRKALSSQLPLLVLFFLIGLTPYLIIPIRAAAGTPINEGHPATAQEFRSYFSRDRYEKAPLYPRMWRHRPNDALYAASWSGGDTTLVGNLRYYGSYQFTYMYLRYLMWNFSGRYNDRQGYGSPQNGQFLTGIPPIDRLLVGTAMRPPESLHTRGHNIYYMLPLLLGILGIIALTDRKRAFWVVMTLFLMGGVILSIYLNHPCYEPRERDYAYILSFYAYCIFIAFGATWVVDKIQASGFRLQASGYLLLAVPALMAFQNWDDHNRSGRYIARDAGLNILESCDHDSQGRESLLFCYGDNDTFPLWYLQSVEDARPDVRVENIGLIGWHRFLELLNEGMSQGQPVYLTHYAYNQFGSYFSGRLQLEGNTYRLCDSIVQDTVAVEPFLRHLRQMQWHTLRGVYVDEVGCKFLEMYWKDVVLLAQHLSAQGHHAEALGALDKTRAEIPLAELQDLNIFYDIVCCYRTAGDTCAADMLEQQLRVTLAEQLRYYHSQSPRRQAAMPFTLAPREALAQELGI